MIHQPVLTREVLKYLNPKPNENFIDATIGLGGHTRVILEKIKPKGKVLGIEVDPVLYNQIKEGKINQLLLINDNYTNLKEIIKKYNFEPVNGILFDLGMSSWHLEKSGRGFSFQRNEPLDMRYNPLIDFRRSSESYYQLTAERIVNNWSQKELERILREYGEERFSRRIARKIVETRKAAPIRTTFQLVEIIKKAIPKRFQHGRIHPATKTFQALRIAVNRELENLQKILPQALEILERDGKIIIISFHSLEDRIVKNFFREVEKKSLIKTLTKKPITASFCEVKKNPRSRSAKLRAAIKL